MTTALLQLTRWLAECDPSKPKLGCGSVLRRVQRHIDAHLCMEDNILFPALEKKGKSLEFDLLRSAHGRVRHGVGRLSGALINEHWSQFCYEAKNFWLELTRLDSGEQTRLYSLMRDGLADMDAGSILNDCIRLRQRARMTIHERMDCLPNAVQ